MKGKRNTSRFLFSKGIVVGGLESGIRQLSPSNFGNSKLRVWHHVVGAHLDTAPRSAAFRPLQRPSAARETTVLWVWER